MWNSFLLQIQLVKEGMLLYPDTGTLAKAKKKPKQRISKKKQKKNSRAEVAKHCLQSLATSAPSQDPSDNF